MSKPIINWWRSQQFKFALSRGDIKKAIKILQEIQKSGAKFSLLEKLFRDKLQAERLSQEYKREIANLSQKLNELPNSTDNLSLSVNKQFSDFLCKKFNLTYHDEYKLQVTGIEQNVFENLEIKLVEYLKEEFSKIPERTLFLKLEDALEDINNLKMGQDPNYKFSLTPHVYFMKYFLENVYCTYLAWFLIYQHNLLTNKINILDIAAGPGTVAYGLALFLQSSSEFMQLPPMHLSYYSLEKQDAFQYRGLQFWRKYIESQINPVNAYYRFVTADLLEWNNQYNNLPQAFFDFIVVSHCFFTDKDKRIKANNNYKQIFSQGLKPEGYALLIIQDKKLFKTYNAYQSEDIHQEKEVVRKFTNEMGLDLVWYKYLSSTNSRKPFTSADFGNFAHENLPKQLHMSSILHQYLGQKYVLHYSLDDYVILARKT